jgi:hypothetical protein
MRLSAAISRPSCLSVGNQPYDLVVDLGGGCFLRVQCKTAREVGGCITFNGHRTDHGHGRRDYLGLADVFGIFYAANETTYLIPRLRLEPTRNNQKQGIRFASDYEIDRWSVESLRALASQEGSGADQLAFA